MYSSPHYHFLKRLLRSKFDDKVVLYSIQFKMNESFGAEKSSTKWRTDFGKEEINKAVGGTLGAKIGWGLL